PEDDPVDTGLLRQAALELHPGRQEVAGHVVLQRLRAILRADAALHVFLDRSLADAWSLWADDRVVDGGIVRPQRHRAREIAAIDGFLELVTHGPRMRRSRCRGVDDEEHGEHHAGPKNEWSFHRLPPWVRA